MASRECFVCASFEKTAPAEPRMLDCRSGDFSVVVCPRCGVPMATLRSHDVIFPERRFVVMREALFEAAREWYGDQSFVIDEAPHADTPHLCWHARACQPQVGA